MTAREPETLALEPDDGIPNSRLPVLIYRGLALAEGPAAAESAFADHGWRGAWRNGIFGFHHFDSTAHEVLAIVAGSVHVRLGGQGGRTLLVARGDVLVLPAGTGHRNEGDSGDLLVVGAYPNGMRWDMRRRELAPTTELRHLQYREDDRQGVGKRSRLTLSPEYIRRYTTEILDQAPLEALVQELPPDRPAALMCVEALAAACHRSLIAQRLHEGFRLPVVHLGPG